jgi:hypothetical protein
MMRMFDEPRRLAGAKTDCAKRSPEGGGAERRHQHQPSRGIGGETDNREAIARRAELPSGSNSVNITEDVRKYAAEQAISEVEALQRGMEEKSKEFVEAGSGLREGIAPIAWQPKPIIQSQNTNRL